MGPSMYDDETKPTCQRALCRRTAALDRTTKQQPTGDVISNLKTTVILKKHSGLALQVVAKQYTKADYRLRANLEQTACDLRVRLEKIGASH
jgi:hypothetical protein